MIKIPDKYHGVAGHLKLHEAEFLYNAPFRLGSGYYANLGTYKGRSATMLAGGVKESRIKGEVVSVDLFPKGFKDVIRNFKDRGVNEYITLIRCSTLDAAAYYSDVKFKFIFIDADHSYRAVKADFKAWSSLLTKDGEIAFHDSDTPGISKFLSELSFSTWKKQGQIMSLSWWKNF